MDNSKKKGKVSTESSKKQPSGTSGSSDFSDESESRRSKKGRYKASSSFMEGLTSSAYTEASESSRNDKRRYKTSSSFTEGATLSVYSDPSGSRKSEKRRNKNPSSSTQGAMSSEYTEASASVSDEKEQKNKPKSFMKGETSVYAVNMPGTSFQTTGTFNTDPPSDSFSSDQSGGTTSTKSSRPNRPEEKIRLMPFKVKDVMEMIKDNPAYKDKSPVMIKVKENDIDQILEGKKVIRGKAEPLDKYLKPHPHESPTSLQTTLKNEDNSLRMSTGAESGRSKISKESTPWPENPFVDEPAFAGADRTQKIFAMPDVQAFPVVQTAPSRRRRGPRHRTPRRRASRSRSRRRRSRTRPRRSRPVQGPPRQSQGRRVMRPYRRYISPCTKYPMCDDDCPVSRPYRRRIPPPRVVSGYNTPYYSENRAPPRAVSGYNTPYYSENRAPPRVVSNYNTPYYVESTTRRVVSHAYNTPLTSSNRGLYYPDKVNVVNTVSRRLIPRPRGKCCCNMCEEKLQFIQPGLCNKRKNVWTNEYAVIPKPQVHLIDPCEELDPAIYPRADNPCIRDGQGNPLTDCIGRPLRSPIGRRFLSFTANGSVMETSIRGNFWTGQPPLCVKCPMPSNSCGEDTTHNWWMSCGYPIMPNMNPFYKRVLAAEMGPC